MKSKAFVALVIVLLLNCFSCKETPTADGNGNGNNGLIVAEDIGVTDVLLKIHMPGAFDQSKVTLKHDTVTILNKTIFSRDTLIVDEGLLPKHTYLYTISFDIPLGLPEHSMIAVTTMDTTSHDFTWEIDTLGDGNSSILRDVAIINDTCVIAVGEINIRDSLGNWVNPPYNLARWNGKEWSLRQVMYNYQGIDYYSQLYSIFAFNENDYWVGSNQPMHWTGNKWVTFDLGSEVWNGWINKIWGSSSSNIYIVGNQGAIAFFNGSSWRKMESGTDVSLTDVWGSPDGSVVWACGWEDFKPTVLLKYQHSVWEKQYEDNLTEFRIREDSLSGVLVSGAVFNKHLFVLTNTGLYKTTWDTRGEGKRLSPYPEGFRAFPFRLRGNAINDMFVVGQRSLIAHYNGVTLNRYEQFINRNIILYSVSQQGNTIVAVGEIYHPIHSKGIVFRGRR